MLRFQPAFKFWLLLFLCSLLLLPAHKVAAKTASLKAELHSFAASTASLPASRVGGTISHIAVYENFAYLYTGYELTIVDIANPATIMTVGEVANLPSRVSDLQVVGKFLYMAIASSPDQLRIYDLTQPIAPRLVTTWQHQDGTLGNFRVTVKGNTAYVMMDDGIHLLNLTDPATPVEIALLPHRASDIDIVGNYAYVASGGLHILDLTNPQNVVEVGKTEPPNGSALLDVAIVGSYAYAAADLAGLQILDISNPLTPTAVSLVTTIPQASKVLVQGNYAFVLGISGAFLVNIANPTAPQVMNATPLFFANRTILDSATRNSTLLLTNGDLYLFDLASVTPLTAIGFYQSEWYSRGVTIANGSAYVSTRSQLYQFDLSDVAQPTLQNALALSATISSLAVVDHYIYNTVGFQGLQIVEATANNALRMVGQLAIPGYAQKVKIFGTRAFVMSGADDTLSKVVNIVDIADPRAPKLVGSFTSDPPLLDFAVQGNYLYLNTNIDTEDAFHVLDITQPTAIQKVLGLRQLYLSLMVHADALYAVDFEANVTKIDIATPTAPRIAWSVKTAGNGVPSLAFIGDRLYVRSLFFDGPPVTIVDRGVEVFALKASGAPQALLTLPGSTLCWTLWVRDGTLYCSGNESGSLSFVQVTTPLYLPLIRTRPS